MATFLSWLYGVADRVYQWFGSAFYQLYAGALNAWTWAVTQASAAYLNAKSYAYGLYQGFLNDLSGLSQWVDYQIGQLRVSISNLTSITYEQVIGWINNGLATVNGAIQAVYSFIAGAIAAAKAELIGLINSGISLATGAIYTAFDWLNTVRTSIINLISQLSPSRLTNLINFLDRTLTDVRQFLSDPVTWILDMVQSDILPALFWLLAIGIAGTHADISKNPPWKER